MSLIKDILEKNENRSYLHYLGLLKKVATEIERLHANNECPNELWVLYSRLNDDSAELSENESVAKVLNDLLGYADEQYDGLPSSIKDIVLYYWEHPEKED